MTDSLCFLHIYTKSCLWPTFLYRQEDSLGWLNTWLLHLAYLLCSQLQCCHGPWGVQFHWILLETFSYRPTKLVSLWKSSPWVLRGWKFTELISGKVSCSSQSDLVVTCGQAFSLCSCFNITNPSSPISCSLCFSLFSLSLSVFSKTQAFSTGNVHSDSDISKAGTSRTQDRVSVLVNTETDAYLRGDHPFSGSAGTISVEKSSLKCYCLAATWL